MTVDHGVNLAALRENQLNALITDAQSTLANREYVRTFNDMLDHHQRKLRSIQEFTVKPGQEWEKPNPLALGSAYARGDEVTHEGKRYRSMVPFNTYAPGTTVAWKTL